MRLLIDEHGPVNLRRLVDVELEHGATVGITVQNLLDEAGFGLTLVPELGQNVGQYIAHVVARERVGVITKAGADEDGPDSILERQAVRQLALDERARRQHAPDFDRRAVVHLVVMAAPAPALAP